MRKTPQQKKSASYAKDRRNGDGENSKASRKNIPRSKARSIRADRRAKEGLLGSLRSVADADALEGIDNTIRAAKPREWRKHPDMPLGEWLKRRRRQRP
ncbi:hypothetical protein IP92_00888 [Pseudoduganella flava]|uniref:Uncharacterized protein n=1 Tax=Pseudoduganella flava TaxID=871742 RepID=A0A562Q016_9BURK|nr:hypothetical protein [Pseudoduganella flava]QGZ38747.1 hypothetical protein GO485_06570 [Pseudoduganella flava]TWI49676.1 hypothetical protein IP92_00888 [Pseudoduganella flava]